MRFSWKWLLMLVGLALLAWFIWKIELDWRLLASAHPVAVFCSILVFLFIIPVTAFRTRALLPVGQKPSLIKLLKTEFSARFVYYVFPFRLNIPAKAIFLQRFAGTRKTIGLSACMFEFFVDSLTAIAIAFIGSYLFFGTTFENWSNALQALAISAIVATFALLFNPVLIRRILAFFEHLPKPLPAITGHIGKVYSQFQAISQKPATELMLPFLLTGVIWLLSAIQTSLLFLAYGLDVPFWTIFTITALGLFIGFLSQVPGGIGFREASMVYLFGLSGVDHSIALAVVLWSRLVTLIPIAIGTFILGRDLQKNDWSLEGLLKTTTHDGEEKKPHVSEKT